MSQDAKNGYGKRPLSQWILIYLIVGGILYGLIYYFIIAQHGGYSVANKQTTSTTSAQTSTTTFADNIYQIKSDSSKGTYIADFQGMTLYTYEKDSPGVSTCVDTCAKNWPPYTSGATAQSTFPENISVITRTNGQKQFAWKQMPLYYFTGDTSSGQLSGDDVNGFHRVKP